MLVFSHIQEQYCSLPIVHLLWPTKPFSCMSVMHADRILFMFQNSK